MAVIKLGIWLDYSNAHSIELTIAPLETTPLESKFTHEAKEHSLRQGENHMYAKKQHQQAEYYKSLCTLISQ
jgi:hypothetical protein